ncbi:hypothetical protein Tco_1503105 [Tanacetum coccineum]
MKKEMRMISKDGTISEFPRYTSSKEEEEEEDEEEEEEEEEEEDEEEEEEEEKEESEKKRSKEASEIGSNSERLGFAIPVFSLGDDPIARVSTRQCFSL